MIHRHLDYPSERPVEELPAAAIVDILDRGDLHDWRPIAVAVARDPHGALADRVARLVDTYPMYGTSPLWRTWIERCRIRAPERSSKTGGPIALADLRRRAGLSQVEVAGRMGISQSDLSKLERRRDVRTSTLGNYLWAVGAHLRLIAGLPDEDLEVSVGEP